jgi:glycosyltransferase involved in cell wall biosynthesis
LYFDKYEVSYVGRIPRKYKNIRVLIPLHSQALGEFLRTQDIFVFASRYEACSNSFLEGLHCGLWVIALDSSSNAEVLSNRGELFSSKPELLAKIDKVANQLRAADRPPEPPRNIGDVARSYIKFAETIAAEVIDDSYSFKRLTWLKTLPWLV